MSPLVIETEPESVLVVEQVDTELVVEQVDTELVVEQTSSSPETSTGEQLTLNSTPTTVLIDGATSLELVSGPNVLVEIADLGPQGQTGLQGPQGPPGEGANTTYIHDQATPSAEWIITHNLGRFPSVITVDSAGTEQDGEIVYLNSSSLKIIFVLPFGGKAYLN